LQNGLRETEPQPNKTSNDCIIITDNLRMSIGEMAIRRLAPAPAEESQIAGLFRAHLQPAGLKGSQILIGSGIQQAST
jgi:hypothetical protein